MHRASFNTNIYVLTEGNGTPLQYSCLENPMDRGAWKAAVHGVTRSRKWLSNFTFTFHFHALEKEMATHSSVLAWRIPGMGEPDGLLSMGSHRVGQDWSDLAAAAWKISVLKDNWHWCLISQSWAPHGPGGISWGDTGTSLKQRGSQGYLPSPLAFNILNSIAFCALS